MTPEEQLDHLIEQWERGAALVRGESLELETRLAVAGALIQLQAIEVSQVFAARLEARVRARAQSLAIQQGKGIAFPYAQAQRGKRQQMGGRRSRHT